MVSCTETQEGKGTKKPALPKATHTHTNNQTLSKDHRHLASIRHATKLGPGLSEDAVSSIAVARVGLARRGSDSDPKTNMTMKRYNDNRQHSFNHCCGSCFKIRGVESKAGFIV